MTQEVMKAAGDLSHCFPESYINGQFEFICRPRVNSYFLLADVDDILTLKCKVLEWLSWDACKSTHFTTKRANDKNHEYHRIGTNKFLGTNFSEDEMLSIYQYIGNGINPERTIEFIESGYDCSIFPF